MSQWKTTDPAVWQGRNDLAEASNALRVFQTLHQTRHDALNAITQSVVLMGFACDEGVRRNQGRTGAADAPDALRRALANLASHEGHDDVADIGTLYVCDRELEQAQQALSETVQICQRNGQRTLVLGGGHETAYAHGSGVYQAWPERRVGIINFDAHLDLRAGPQATSGTPFRQLAEDCRLHNRPFNYLCVGVSQAANTQALLEQAQTLGVEIIWDTECQITRLESVARQIDAFASRCEVLYLTIDLDVLPAWQMPGVSAPAAYGVPVETLVLLIRELCQRPELRAIDLVEYNPQFDPLMQGARVAGRMLWQILHDWQRENPSALP